MRIAALLYLAATASLAQQANPSPVTAKQARDILPRAELSGLTDAQRGVFVAVATYGFAYFAVALGAGVPEARRTLGRFLPV